MATSYNKIISRNLHLPLAQAVAYRSVSHNPYVNISLDDWFYQNYPLRSQHYPLLYLYRNHPCIVIGRHQNPWTECNSKLVGIYPDQVPLVRRRSGGGAVYHDLGNLNVTIVSHRSQYDRKRNLEMIANALKETWNLDISVNDRSDLVINGTSKISGSASRLGRLVAYHHFTLLFHSKLQQLAQMLTPHTNGLRSNATASVRSSVINLSQINNAITYDNLCSKIASTFTKTFHPKLNNEELLDINPSTESNYPGIASLRNEMKSWDWIYGKTPDFEIHQSSNLSMGKVTISVVIRKGIISEIKLDVSKAIPSAIIDEISSGLVGCRYGTEDVSGIVYYLEAKSDGMNSRTRTAELIRWLMIILGRN